jgi:hypothetical protein
MPEHRLPKGSNINGQKTHKKVPNAVGQYHANENHSAIFLTPY